MKDRADVTTPARGAIPPIPRTLFYFNNLTGYDAEKREMWHLDSWRRNSFAQGSESMDRLLSQIVP
jgi:hypothetical protein